MAVGSTSASNSTLMSIVRDLRSQLHEPRAFESDAVNASSGITPRAIGRRLPSLRFEPRCLGSPLGHRDSSSSDSILRDTQRPDRDVYGGLGHDSPLLVIEPTYAACDDVWSDTLTLGSTRNRFAWKRTVRLAKYRCRVVSVTSLSPSCSCSFKWGV